jgi:hypothetical protein
MSVTPLPRGVIELDRSPPFRNAEQLLARAEAEIALLDRVQPLNIAAEREALIAAFGAGKPRAPRFQYRARPELGRLRAELISAVRSLEAAGPLGALYAGRAQELELEACIAEHIDSASFAEHAARRYPCEESHDADVADAWAARWIRVTERRSTTLHRSDDRGDPQSLASMLERATLGLPVRVEIRPNQAAAAAVGEGFIGVRPGLWHTEREILRIVLHEVEGHARPRVTAQREALGLFRVGVAQGSDDEEGRALLLERRARVLEGERQRELARRHLAARNVRAGVSFVGTVTELLGLGQDIASAVEAACRAYRGGGLAREYVYLVALSRVERAFGAEPALERWFERGRMSVTAARVAEAQFERDVAELGARY